MSYKHLVLLNTIQMISTFGMTTYSPAYWNQSINQSIIIFSVAQIVNYY